MPPKTKESFFLYFKIFCTKVRIHKFGSSSRSSSSSVGKLSKNTEKIWEENLLQTLVRIKPCVNFFFNKAHPGHCTVTSGALGSTL